MAKLLPFKVKGQEGAIPAIGLGTATIKGERCTAAVVEALKLGYKLLDTALLYGNQEAVGEGIKQSGIDRDSVWVTSKVGFFPPNCEGVWMWDSNNVKGDEAASIDLSLEQLGLEQLDLCLIHNPCAARAEYNAAGFPHFFELFANAGDERAVKPVALPDGQKLRPLLLEARRNQILESEGGDLQQIYAKSRAVREKTWKNMEAAVKAGKCKYIGVSNWPAALLEEMLEYAEIMPAVNQLELHPKFASPELQATAKRLGVVLTGYGTGNSLGIHTDPVIQGIADRLRKSPIQVVIQWTVQSGVAAIPRTSTTAHLVENLAAIEFELSAQDMAAINALDEAHPYYWDPLASNLTADTATIMAGGRSSSAGNGRPKTAQPDWWG